VAAYKVILGSWHVAKHFNFMNVSIGDKIKFRLDDGYVNEGYVYQVKNDTSIAVSQNRHWTTIGFAQNWIVRKDQITENFGKCDGCSF